VLGALLVVLAVQWSRARHTWYWMDEGIAIGISSHPLSEIPGLLRQDASPPFYYLVLHVWTSVFGDSESRTHLLSLLFALGTIPTAFWAGRSLFGRRTGWTCAVLAAVSPFIAAYTNETRMYSLVVLLALVATATFLHSFVYRRRGHLTAFVLSLVLLLYTHNWGLFFAAGAGVAVVVCLLSSADRRPLLVDAVLAFGTSAVLYSPWVPTLLYQQAHTGSPSTPKVTLGGVSHDIARSVGSRGVWIALGLSAAGGLVATVCRSRGRPISAVVAAAAIPIVAIAGACAVSMVSPVWSFRYLAVVVPSVLLLAAMVLRSAGRPALFALAVIAFLSAPLHGKGLPYAKSNVRDLAAQVSSTLRPGDLVISPVGEVPLLAYYLPQDLRFATPTGAVRDARIADWRDNTKRLEETDTRAAVLPLIDAVPAGGHVLVVCPPPAGDLTVFVRYNFRRCDEARSLVRDDPRFRLDLMMKDPPGVGNTPAEGQLLTKLV
jgi:hypothetical protein